MSLIDIDAGNYILVDPGVWMAAERIADAREAGVTPKDDDIALVADAILELARKENP